MLEHSRTGLGCAAWVQALDHRCDCGKAAVHPLALALTFDCVMGTKAEKHLGMLGCLFWGTRHCLL